MTWLNDVVEQLYYLPVVPQYFLCCSELKPVWSVSCAQDWKPEHFISVHWHTDKPTDGQTDGGADGARWPVNQPTKLFLLSKSTGACWCWSGPLLACVLFRAHVVLCVNAQSVRLCSEIALEKYFFFPPRGNVPQSEYVIQYLHLYRRLYMPTHICSVETGSCVDLVCVWVDVYCCAIWSRPCQARGSLASPNSLGAGAAAFAE